MKSYDISRLPSEITLGYDGENNWRPQKFDCSVLLKNHPSGVITLWLLPDGESQAFPVALERDGNTVVWTPLDEEMTAKNGALQIVCIDNGDVGKSGVVAYEVKESIIPGAEHPASVPSWATQTIERAEDAADRAEEAAQSIDVEHLEQTIAVAVADYLDEHPVQVEESDPESVHFSEAQTLTAAQQAQARENIGIEFMTAAEVDEMWGNIDGLPDGDEVSY